LVRYVSNDPVTGKGAFASIPVAFITVFAMMLFFVVVATSFTGYVRLRLSLQARQLQEQIDQLEHQRTLIVEAEQRVRREVATILHDDFQGELLRATLRLSRLADTTSPEHAEPVREVVANLERLRGEGVRSLSRRLAPPIESIGFASALDELVRSYHGTIVVTVAIESEIEIALAGDGGDQPLALYRIIEQALLNAAAHGHARHVAISLTLNLVELRLTVDDDGQGLPATITQGTGTAIIASWVGVTGGTWSLAPGEQQGTRLVVTIPRG
ncbi:MAG: ATP-binding protein, partial [Thermoleophilia bacterium]